MNKGGVVLIVLGALFLAMNFGLFHWDWMRQWWPLILIGIGLWLLTRSDRRERPSRSGDRLP